MKKLLLAFSGYYAVTGAWPLVHMASFEAVTGRKTDRWLVNMVGSLALVNGLTIALGLRGRERASRDVVTLALLSAAAFAAIDVTYVARRTIRPIYLADAAIECGFIIAICGSSKP